MFRLFLSLALTLAVLERVGAEAPLAATPQTILELDHEFDSGSGIRLTTLTPAQIENLATLAKVWGFLKYHHPKVMAGRLHWDYELFRIMPAVLAAKNRISALEVLTRWIKDLGEATPGVRESLANADVVLRPDVAWTDQKNAIGDGLNFGLRAIDSPPPTMGEQFSVSDVAPGMRENLSNADVALRPDVAWIDDKAALGNNLSDRLRAIEEAGPPMGEQFYVSMAPGAGNPVFVHEMDYPAIKFPDGGYQLLALFRLWNIVRYWYPYRDLVTQNWDDVLTEFIPRFGVADSPHAYRLQLFALLAKVSDTHANLWSSLGEQPPVGIFKWPIVVRYIQGQPVVARVLDAEGATTVSFSPGDIILSIDGTPVESLVKQWSEYYPASNESTRLREIARAMGRGSAGSVKVRVQRGHETVDVEARRIPLDREDAARPSHDLPGPAFRLLSKDVAYMKLSSAKETDVESYVKQALGTRGWIIDIRDYPSGIVFEALGSHLVSVPTAFVRFSHANLSMPGEFLFTNPQFLKPQEPRYAGKIIILVDETTQSAAEYAAMAFRSAPGAIVLGSTTAGADGNVSRIQLPGGLHTRISGLGVFYPDKRPTQQIGIVPNIEVNPTVEGVRMGRDEVLEAALKQIVGQ